MIFLLTESSYYDGRKISEKILAHVESASICKAVEKIGLKDLDPSNENYRVWVHESNPSDSSRLELRPLPELKLDDGLHKRILSSLWRRLIFF